ncbi:hypothetical protein FACS189490_07870 [Clostridia bacterium]|nr:hypothetical protein FACS189490_07870 [Clostridia bacterium]
MWQILTLEALVPAIDISGVDFTILVDTIISLVPPVLGVVVPLVAIRKGISFLSSAIRGA